MNCRMKKFSALLGLLLALTLTLGCLCLNVFAEDTTTADEVTEADATEAEAADDGATQADGTEAAAVVTDGNSEAETKSPEEIKEQKTRGIINLCVGGVILIVIVVLLIVFRKKLPAWFKGLKSECKKIVWCPKDKLRKNTIVVVVIILILAAAIAIMDFAFTKLLTGLLPDLIGKIGG